MSQHKLISLINVCACFRVDGHSAAMQTREKLVSMRSLKCFHLLVSMYVASHHFLPVVVDGKVWYALKLDNDHFKNGLFTGHQR